MAMKHEELTGRIIKVLNYLWVTDVHVGLVLNFGPQPEFKRMVFR